MKQIRLYSGLLLSLSLVFASCSSSSDDSGNPPTDDDNPPVGITLPTVQGFNNLREAALEDHIQTFNVDVGSSGTVEFTSDKETTFMVLSTNVRLNSDSFTGEAEIEFVELYDRTDMVLTGFDTMGEIESESLEMLTSGGVFNLKMYSKETEEPLTLNAAYTMTVPSSITGEEIQDNMKLWYGNYDNNGNLVWNNEEEQSGNIVPNTINNKYSIIGVKEFGWTSIGKIYAAAGQKTTFKANVPTGYNAENSAVYLSFEGENSALARLSMFENKTFSQTLIPVGKNCQVIFVSESEGKWVYAIKSATIAANGSVTFETSDLKTATQAELVTKLNELP
ncbi:MAG: hypothetical protein AB7D46_09700 [Flavobacteriaceae bacterium]